MKKDLATLVCAVCLLGTASTVFAGAYGEPAQPEEAPSAAPAPPIEAEAPPAGYWYLGAGALFSIENFECQADDAWGYNLRAGRRINSLVAVEAEWEHPASDFGNISRVDGWGNLGSDVEAWNLTANAKVYPVKGRVQPYALVGVGYGEANLPHDQNTGFISRFGLGLDFMATENFGVDAEVGYVLGTGDLANFDQIPISVGIFYNFL